MTRLFIALKIPADIRKKIIKLRKEIIPENVFLKWEPEKKIHLTLKFIGEVEDNLVDKISDELKFIEEYDKFICSFTKFGFFFKRKEAKILWLGLSIDERIKELSERLNKILEKKFSIPVEEREFKAHLTLLRIKNKVDDLFIKNFLECKIPEQKFIADEVSLYKSELLQSGSKYIEIKNYKLK